MHWSLTMCVTLHLPLLNFMRFLSSHFSRLSRYLWMLGQSPGVSVTPFSFVSSENLLRMHSAPLSRSLMKMLYTTASSINPWSMILLTDMQLDFMPLVTTLWTQPYSQFSVHLTVYLSSSILHQLACEEVAGDSVKRLTKVNRNNIHSSPLIRGASHLITEGYQVGQACFSLCKSMLTTPQSLLARCMSGNGF